MSSRPPFDAVRRCSERPRLSRAVVWSVVRDQNAPSWPRGRGGGYDDTEAPARLQRAVERAVQEIKPAVDPGICHGHLRPPASRALKRAFLRDPAQAATGTKTLECASPRDP
ncbi:hypothetical protein SKAU_G00124500 [Synaphobranchus kaupii]|uniref:Uncharacterized protein n=1 Tax=Synaphobranchus kaupii TaxID=118154 RepID=A0A9Q1J1S0_SYNKA|nr:hypothetical protein SKAU_G00124500 [Synaphobranchus kaupii]